MGTDSSHTCSSATFASCKFKPQHSEKFGGSGMDDGGARRRHLTLLLRLEFLHLLTQRLYFFRHFYYIRNAFAAAAASDTQCLSAADGGVQLSSLRCELGHVFAYARRCLAYRVNTGGRRRGGAAAAPW